MRDRVELKSPVPSTRNIEPSCRRIRPPFAAYSREHNVPQAIVRQYSADAAMDGYIHAAILLQLIGVRLSIVRRKRSPEQWWDALLPLLHMSGGRGWPRRLGVSSDYWLSLFHEDEMEEILEFARTMGLLAAGQEVSLPATPITLRYPSLSDSRTLLPCSSRPASWSGCSSQLHHRAQQHRQRRGQQPSRPLPRHPATHPHV